jgi:N-acetylglutamate synthase-like GNAT family acetyltransferase
MNIESIADHLELLPIIGQWHWDEWGHADPNGSVDTWTAGLGERTLRDQIPTTYIALSSQSDLLGSVTLVDSDMDTHQELTPWLAGLYVQPDFRNLGIGSKLVNHAVNKVRSMGISQLFLYSSTAAGLYMKLGWQVINEESYEGEKVSVMVFNLV